MFQLPMLVFVLARFGIVTAGFLAKNFSYALLIFFVVSAIVTPDGSMVPQIIMAASMTALYVISIARGVDLREETRTRTSHNTAEFVISARAVQHNLTVKFDLVAVAVLPWGSCDRSARFPVEVGPL